MTSSIDESHLIIRASYLQGSREPSIEIGFQDPEEVETTSLWEAIRANRSASPYISIPLGLVNIASLMTKSKIFWLWE